MRDIPRRLKGDQSGQIMGIPLYILLIVLIAVVSLSAILGFLVTSSPTIDRVEAKVTHRYGGRPDAPLECDRILDDGTAKPDDDPYIVVYVRDENGDPMQNIDVHITGCGADASGTTNYTGQISVVLDKEDIRLEPNQENGKMIITAVQNGMIGSQKKKTSLWVVRKE